jgi:hypothetical protein
MFCKHCAGVAASETASLVWWHFFFFFPNLGFLTTEASMFKLREKIASNDFLYRCLKSLNIFLGVVVVATTI